MTNCAHRPKPLALIILDGYGHSDDNQDNAINQANRPVFDRLWREYSHTLISGSGLDVGLPDGQMGNSEVGHLNLGAGRIVYQDFTRVTKAIADGEFEQNPVLNSVIDGLNDQTLHIFGLLSPGGVHAHEDHIIAMVEMAAKKGVKNIALHAFLDGRDTPPRSAKASLERLDKVFAKCGVGKTASLVGRYYAMDRDKRWDRVQLAYDMLTLGKADYCAESAVAGLKAAYARNENDEFVKPTIIGDVVKVKDGDAVVFMNFRADRARELTHAFVDQDFDGFTRQAHPKLADFVSLTEYEAGLVEHIAFPPDGLKNVLGDVLAQHHMTQLRIAETEKYAHVTFFFSGGVEAEYPDESRILVKSPDVATYDLQPEMNAFELTDQLVDAIEGQKYDVIICNYANADMVGHTGNLEATKKAIEALDVCLGRIEAALKKVGGEALITADHGNAEKMKDQQTGQAHTAHTSNPVPLIYIGRQADVLHNDGQLSDIAPTMLKLLNMDQPKEMTGRALFEPE